MARKTFLWYIFNKNRKPLYLDKYGIMKEGDDNYLKPDGQPACLVEDPDGWKDATVKYARNILYWGLFRDFTSPLTFIRDGKEILNNLLFSEGIETVSYFGVRKLDRFSLPYDYRKWYFSNFNFSKFRKTETGMVVETLEGGLGKLLKAYENTKFEIPIDTDPEHINVLNDGLNLIGRQTYLVGAVPYTAAGLLRGIMAAATLTEEGKSTGVTFGDSNFEDFFPDFFSYLETSVNHFAIAGNDNLVPINVHTKGSFPFRLAEKRDLVDCNIQIIKVPALTPPAWVPVYYDLYNPTTLVGTPFTFKGEVKQIEWDLNIPLAPGEKLFLAIDGGSFGDGSGEHSDYEVLDGGTFYCEYKNRYRSTITKGLYAVRVLEKLIENIIKDQVVITNDNIFYKSEFLDELKSLCVTSIDAIRGIVTNDTQKGATITTSLSDFFKSINHFGIALGIKDGKIIIERWNDFFKSNTVLSLGEVSKPELIYAEDISFNTIKVGGPKVEYNDVNGKFETNQEQIWKTPVTQVVRELDLSTPWRRDPYGFEFKRIDLTGKDTTDSSDDNDVCMLNIETVEQTNPDTGLKYFKLYRPAVTINNMPDPDSLYNFFYTPKWTILNNGSFIRSMMHLMDARIISLANKEKYSDMEVIGTIRVKEGEDFQIGSLAAAVLQPYYLNCTSESELNLTDILDVDPFGITELTVDGKAYKFYLMDGGVKPGDNDKQAWKLLSVISNNVKELNR